MTTETTQTPRDRDERRRLRLRRFANLVIAAALLGLLGVVFYFVGSCVYTGRQQDQLRERLATDNPELAGAEATVSEGDFISIKGVAESIANAASAAQAEAERQSELAALKTAAEAFAVTLTGQVRKPIGRIIIPKIGVDVVMVEGALEGASESYLKVGPGHWPETPLPGQGGSFVASGHRTTWGAPFLKLNELAAGDEIELILPYAIVRYTVTQVIVVAPDDMGTVADQGREQVSLVACHPVYSARQRIIAQGDMSSFVLLETEERP
jgi:LPXTG-site transpeptidase (sortase) family protein